MSLKLRIVEELMEIWPNEVCDNLIDNTICSCTDHYRKKA